MTAAAGPPDRHELERLYQRYGASVLRRARRILGDDQAAHDVCHDIFLEILRASSWAPASPLGWLYAATTHRCLNVLRSDRRRRMAFARLPVSSPEAPLLEAAMLLDRIPPELQTIAVFTAVDQMSQAEIGVVLGLSQKTVSNRLRELRALLEAGGAPVVGQARVVSP